MTGTSILARVDRVVDGDTIRVFLDTNSDKSESLRILALDTEEVFDGTKPKTPMGQKASERAKQLVKAGDEVTLVLPGTEPVDVAIDKYRGNYGRLTVFIMLADGTDYQELMIKEGFSPYFVKYGYAEFSQFHERYLKAEKEAQAKGLGIWNQEANNGYEARNYGTLATWWDLRAQIIEAFRNLKRSNVEANVFDPRSEHAQLVDLAKKGQKTTIFTELKDYRVIADHHVVFYVGSKDKQFQVFIPHGHDSFRQDILRLIETRYMSAEDKFRRSYVYISGEASMYPDENGTAQIVVTDIEQISDKF